jgi:hypothetical protein
MDASFFDEGTLVGGNHLGEPWCKPIGKNLGEDFSMLWTRLMCLLSLIQRDCSFLGSSTMWAVLRRLKVPPLNWESWSTVAVISPFIMSQHLL